MLLQICRNKPALKLVRAIKKCLLTIYVNLNSFRRLFPCTFDIGQIGHLRRTMMLEETKSYSLYLQNTFACVKIDFILGFYSE